MKRQYEREKQKEMVWGLRLFATRPECFPAELLIPFKF